jgi:hypothetical protein
MIIASTEELAVIAKILARFRAPCPSSFRRRCHAGGTSTTAAVRSAVNWQVMGTGWPQTRRAEAGAGAASVKPPP